MNKYKFFFFLLKIFIKTSTLIIWKIILKDNQILNLEKELSNLIVKRDQLKPTEELSKLLTEQEKLKYRIKILKRVNYWIN